MDSWMDSWVQLWYQISHYISMLFYLACCITIVIKFRASVLAAIFGGLAFGLPLLSSVVQLVLTFLGVEWWQFGYIFSIVHLIGIVFLFVAILTAPTRKPQR